MLMVGASGDVRVELFEPAHVPAIIELRKRNLDRLRRFELVPDLDEAAMSRWVRDALHGFADGNRLEGVIVLRGEAVGLVGLRMNWYASTGNLTCWLDAASEGQHAASAAARIMIGEGFSRGLHRIEFRVARGNERSIRGVRALGATLDGTMRGGHQSPAGPVDLLVFGMLADEWLLDG